MTIAVDASVAFLWLVEMPDSRQAEALLARNEPIIAPDLIFAETANALWKSVAFADLAPSQAVRAISVLDRLFAEVMPSRELKSRALSISVELRHPAYDCFYLALAEERSCRVVTNDQRLQRRCKGTAFEKSIMKLI